MEVDAKHKLYYKYLPQWKKCRLVAEGSEDVKQAGESFLPRLSKQKNSDYRNYKNRALFYEATTRTLNGFVGMLFAKNFKLSVDIDDPIYSSIFSFYNTLASFLRMATKDVITTGRGGFLADADADGNSYISYYMAESVLNWRTVTKDGKKVLSFLSLYEEEEVVHSLFETEIEKYCRILYLDEEGHYSQDLYKKVKTENGKEEYLREAGFPMKPQINGVPFNTIQFYFVGSTGNFIDPTRPPLIGLVNANISHYMNSADLEHGRHFTGLPTPWVAGFTQEDSNELQIGSQVAWVSSNADAKAGFLEFTGQGLQSLENALKEKQEMMVILGARLLETPKKISESSENQETRKQGEMSILSNISISISNAISEALTVAAKWRNDTRPFTVEISKDFHTESMDSQKLNALISAVQSGLISYETLFYNLQSAGIIPDGTKIDDEKLAIDDTVNTLLGGGKFDNNQNPPKTGIDD